MKEYSFRVYLVKIFIVCKKGSQKSLSWSRDLFIFFLISFFIHLAQRFDYASLLNIVCQKCKFHTPKFVECPGEQGGFGYKCQIGQNTYKGYDFCTTKKDAKHECARWALLGMEIPGLGKIRSFSLVRI